MRIIRPSKQALAWKSDVGCGQLPQVQPAAGSLSQLLQRDSKPQAAKMPQHQLLLLITLSALIPQEPKNPMLSTHTACMGTSYRDGGHLLAAIEGLQYTANGHSAAG